MRQAPGPVPGPDYPAERVARRRSRRDESRVASLVNLAGVVAAAMLMLSALARLAIVEHPMEPVVGDPPLQLDHFLHLDPMAWASIGCLLLTATPILRMVVLAVTFLVRGRHGFALAALLVVAFLAAGIVTGMRIAST